MAITGELTFPDVPGKINEHNQNPSAHSIRIENNLTDPAEGMAADAKAVKDLVDTVSGQIEGEIDDLGGEVTDLKSAIGNKSSLNTDTKTNLVLALNEVNGHFLDGIDTAVENWLDNHPEATTTVQDGSLTYKKFVTGTLGYVTPEMFGAKGDGETDDTVALQAAFNSGHPVYLCSTYAISQSLNVLGLVFGSNTCLIKLQNKSNRITSFLNQVGDLTILNVNFDLDCSIPVTESDYSNTYNIGINNNHSYYDLYAYKCKFSNVYMTAIDCGYCGGKIIIDNCEFLPGSGNATRADHIRLYSSSESAETITVRNSHFKGIASTTINYCGIYMANLTNPRIIVCENYFESCGRKGEHRLAAIDCYSRVDNITIKDNTIVQNRWNGIRMHTTNNAVVENNYINIDTSIEYVEEYAIFVSNAQVQGNWYNFNNIKIKGNTIVVTGGNNLMYGIEVYTTPVNGYVEKIGNCTISDNNISGNITYSIYANNACQTLRVLNNVVSDSLSYCINILESDYTDAKIEILSNVLSGLNGIFYRDTGSGDVCIANNRIENSNGYCVNATGTTSKIINNIFGGVNGSSGGSIVAFNNYIGLTGSYVLLGDGHKIQNYKDGVLIA